MKISNIALEESIVALLCFSNEHAPVVALRIRDHALFSNDTWKKLAETSVEFIRKYACAPNGQLKLILEDSLRRGTEGNLLEKEIDRLQNLQVHAELTIENLDRFIETQQLQKSLQDSMELLDRGELTEAKSTLYKQVSIPQKGSPGILLNDPRQALSFLDHQEETDFFPSGIEVFDRRGVRPERKTLTFMIAATGKGKTFWLIEVGKGAWQYHKKVLHITLELSEEKTARRYIQSIFSLTTQEASQVSIPRFERNEHGYLTSISIYELQRDSVLAKRRQIFDSLEKMKSLPKLMIKEFPPNSLSTEHLCLYLDSLKRDNGFEPDEIIIDYADLMKIDKESLRIDTGRLYVDLRGIGVSRNIAMVSASQGNALSEDAKLVGLRNVAEDWSKNGTADNVFTFSQTPDEKRLGLARIFAAKARDAEDRFIALISQAYCFGQFALDSVIMNVEAVNQIKQLSDSGSN